MVYSLEGPSAKNFILTGSDPSPYPSGPWGSHGAPTVTAMGKLDRESKYSTLRTDPVHSTEQKSIEIYSAYCRRPCLLHFSASHSGEAGLDLSRNNTKYIYQSNRYP